MVGSGALALRRRLGSDGRADLGKQRVDGRLEVVCGNPALVKEDAEWREGGRGQDVGQEGEVVALPAGGGLVDEEGDGAERGERVEASGKLVSEVGERVSAGLGGSAGSVEVVGEVAVRDGAVPGGGE